MGKACLFVVWCGIEERLKRYLNGKEKKNIMRR